MSNPGAVSRETVSPQPADEQVRAALCARYPAAGDALAHYAGLLADAGVTRGLIGPRERPRLWSGTWPTARCSRRSWIRGSGWSTWGPGPACPACRSRSSAPTCRSCCVEPLLRRATFLREAVSELGLEDRVEVRRSRAEDLTGPLGDVVTARAVAPLDRLAAWTLPLVAIGGSLLALKGGAATEEAQLAGAALARLGGGAGRGRTVRHRCVVEPAHASGRRRLRRLPCRSRRHERGRARR